MSRSRQPEFSTTGLGAIDRALVYRPDIDGLRAVAVLAVVAFHAAPDFLPGGFAGVDVFFVISGFLITGILLGNARAHRGLLEFFARRIRRIFPALILVLATSLLLGWYLLLTDEFERLSRHAAAAAAFMVNFVFLREAGYFDATAEFKPLLHLWSLAVEEQFYLFWPVLLGWAGATARSIPLIAGVLIVASLLSNMAVVTHHGPAAFFLLPTRLWELMAGGLLYCGLAQDRWMAANRAWPARDVLAVAGLAILATAFVIVSRQRHYPGAWALLPVIGTCCVIAGGARAWVNRTVLAHPWLVFVGLISYPLYLWHWPTLAFLRIVEGGDIGAIRTLAALAGSFALAAATFIWIERPIRRGRHRAMAWALVATMTVAGAVGCAGAFGWFRARDHAGGFDRFNAATQDWDFPGQAFRPWKTANGLGVTSVGTGSRKILFVGDSNAQQYGPRMERLVSTHPEADAEIIFATNGGCPPMPGAWQELRPECEAFVDKVLSFARGSEVSDVVFVAQWMGYLNPASLVFARKDGSQMTGAAATDAVLENFGSMIRDLVTAGKKVHVVLNIPVGTELDPRYVLHRQWSGAFTVRSQGLARSAWEEGIRGTVLRLAEAARGAGAAVIDPADALCGSEVCRSVTPDGEPIYRDGFHLRASYVREHVHYLDSIVLGRRPG